MQSNNRQNNRLVNDAAGREVLIPDTIKSIIALRSGTLRLLSYLKATDKVIAVEENEKRRTVPYLFANPHLKELPVVGSGNIAETELLTAYQPDLILVSYFTSGEADELQSKTGIPVVVIDYADFNERREDFYKSLRFLGSIINNKERADSLIHFINHSISDLEKRSGKKKNISKVYIGGIAYRGSHGINSTGPAYAPFTFLGLNNVATDLGEVISSPRAWVENAFIDLEQLIEWNPDYIFLDAAGKVLWQKDIGKEALQKSLKAFQNEKLYVVLPHNWYTTNYENIICNAYYIGKIMYPDMFSDIVIKEKVNEIYSEFLGKPIYDSMKKKFDAYKKIKVMATGTVKH